MKAYGGTQMTDVFVKTMRLLEKRRLENNVKDTCVIFLTDG